MRIRPIEAGDIGQLLTLQRAAFVDEAWLYGTADVPSLNETLDDLARRLDRSHTLVAELHRRVVGAVSLCSRRDGGPDVERLMVAPDMRGAGLGTRLMTAIEAQARRGGHDTIQLVVGEIAVLNQELYRRLGYEVTARFPLDTHPHVSLLSMSKRLPSPDEPRQATK